MAVFALLLTPVDGALAQETCRLGAYQASPWTGADGVGGEGVGMQLARIRGVLVIVGRVPPTLFLLYVASVGRWGPREVAGPATREMRKLIQSVQRSWTNGGGHGARSWSR